MTQLQYGARVDVLERLCVGIGADELHALDVAVDHVLDGVATATTDTNDFNHGILRDVVYELEHSISPFPLPN